MMHQLKRSLLAMKNYANEQQISILNLSLYVLSLSLYILRLSLYISSLKIEN